MDTSGNQSVSSIFFFHAFCILFRMQFHITLFFSKAFCLSGDLYSWVQGFWATHFRNGIFRLSSEMGIRLLFWLRPLRWTFRQSSGFQPYSGFLSSSCFQYLNLSSTGQLLWGRVSYSFCAMTPVNNSILFCNTYLSIYTRYLYYMIHLRLSFLDLVFVKVQRTLLYSDNSFWSTIGINNYLLNE